MGSPRRDAPPPLEGNDNVIIITCMTAWAVALVVLLVLYGHIPPSSRWWVWTCAVGVGLGAFALFYVPRLKRSRAAAAQRRAAARDRPPA
jgi:H+/Cl- antiporter ClcA